MTAFVTLAPVYSMPAASPGDVDLPDVSCEGRVPGAQPVPRQPWSCGPSRSPRSPCATRPTRWTPCRTPCCIWRPSYSERPPAEWKPLFYRILENRIRDMQRRRIVRGKVMAWLPFRRGEEDDEMPDPIAAGRQPRPLPRAAGCEMDEAMKALEAAVRPCRTASVRRSCSAIWKEWTSRKLLPPWVVLKAASRRIISAPCRPRGHTWRVLVMSADEEHQANSRSAPAPCSRKACPVSMDAFARA